MNIIAKKRTHDDYVEELLHINSDICVVGEFTGVMNHILHKCKICDYEWRATPNNILHGTKCPQCYKNNRTKTHETFCKEVYSINNTIKILSEYKNAKTKLDCECKICGHIWTPYPEVLLRGGGCPKCAQKLIGDKNKMTHEEFLSKLPPKTIECTKILGRYQTHNTKILCECNMCGYEWEASPTVLLRGSGCIKCGHISTANAQTKTHQQFVEELSLINPDIEILESYTKGSNKIKCKCLICNNIWEPCASSLLAGKSCPYCYGNHKLTHEEFLDKLPDKTKQNIEFLTKYVSAKIPIKCRCKICSHVWDTTSTNLYQGSGCKKCAGLIPKTNEEFLNSLSNNIIENISLDGKYINSKSVIHCTCKICGYVWDSTTNRLLLGNGCRKCANKQNGKNRMKSHEDFIKQVHILNKDVTVIDTYSGVNNKLSCRCNICNRIWETTPAVLLQGCGCSCCKIPLGEKHIIDLLEEHNITYISQYKFCGLKGVGGKLLSYDFYLPQYNLLIEFQGEQHKHPVEYFGGEERFKIQQEHDRRKYEYAKKNNINLLEIWYYDIDNIESILLQKINEVKENNLKLESVETTGVA